MPQRIYCILLPMGIAFYLMYPLLSGHYVAHDPEYYLIKSYMNNFIDTLRKGELPVWNEFVAGGQSMLYFAHYPINQNTLLYLLFGYNDLTHSLTVYFSLVILFLSFICTRKYLHLNHTTALIGALVYFSVNYLSRYFTFYTIENLFSLFPLLMILMIKIIDENKTKDILIFSLAYIFWFSGNKITHLLMSAVMLGLTYWVTAFVFYKTKIFKPAFLKKLATLFFILFFIPLLAVAYQYYIVYNTIGSSNRMGREYIVSPLAPTAWLELARSLHSSAYFWVGCSLLVVYAGLKWLSAKNSPTLKKTFKLPVASLLLAIPVLYLISLTPVGSFGNNIVKNGEFKGNTEGWIIYLTTIESIEGGLSDNALKITSSENSPGHAYYIVPTEIGREYEVIVHYKKGLADNGKIKVGNSIGDASLYSPVVPPDADWKRYRGIFKANSNHTYITLENNTSSPGQTSFFDAVSVKKVGLGILGDYEYILHSTVFQIALTFYLLITCITLYAKKGSTFDIDLASLEFWLFTFIAYTSMLSYYFYSPGNIMGWDLMFFKEMSVPFQVIFTLFVMLSLNDYQNNKVIKVAILSLVLLYFIRSHFTILFLRFLGIVWYGIRDGTVFSLFFAILFMHGLKGFMFDFSIFMGKTTPKQAGKYFQHGFLLFILALFAKDSFVKIYKGASNGLIIQNENINPETPWYQLMLDQTKESWLSEEHKLLTTQISELNHGTKHFYRIYTPHVFYGEVLAGQWQQFGVHESLIYDTCISKQLKDFFDFTIIGKKPVQQKEMKDILPYHVFPRHVHEGLNFYAEEIANGETYVFVYNDDNLKLKEDNLDLFWDLMQVKYLLLSSSESNILENSANSANYKQLTNYPKLGVNLYEITKNKNYSRLAVLPLENQQNFDETITQLNSKNIDTLKYLYSKLTFLDPGNSDFNLINSERAHSDRHYEIKANQKALLIDFESWSHNWKLTNNDRAENIDKVFQIFKGIRLEPGLNRIEQTWRLAYFKELFWVSIAAILAYVTLSTLVLIFPNTKINRILIGPNCTQNE